jgi:hypothetical protein
VAAAALDEQLRRIDSLDTKAGIVIAADSVLSGLVFGRGTALSGAPRPLATAVVVAVLLSLLCALGAFMVRRYETAPSPRSIGLRVGASGDWLKWRFLPNLLQALDRNNRRLTSKSTLLTIAQGLLFVAVGVVGGYFTYVVITGPAK